MTAWEITPEGVASVLTGVSVPAEALESAFVAADLEALFAQFGDVPAPGLAAAMAEYFEAEKATVKGMFTRIQACVMGAGVVTQTYVDGDRTMLAQTQSAAVRASVTGDFSFADR